MKQSTERRYAGMADQELGVYQDVHVGRSDIVASEGATGRAWLKFNPGKELIWLTDADGIPRWVTRTQLTIYQYVLSHSGTFIRMRSVAASLRLTPSTISRALVKLASYGLIVSVTGRGRYGGTFIAKRVTGDGFERFRKLAKERVRAWAKAASERAARLRFNVATYKPTKAYGVYTVSGTDYVTVTVMDATLKAWTPDELREAGVI